MINFSNIKAYSTTHPSWSFLGTPDDVNKLSEAHKDQIFFLNKDATEFIINYINGSNMMTGPAWEPLNNRYFSTIEKFKLTENCNDEIKKWLYNKPVSFDTYVFMYGDISDQVVMLTWKMVIKYCEDLFFGHDILLLDETLNWCLFYYHEDLLYFGTDKIYDAEFDYEKTIQANELKRKYFNKDKLHFTKEEKRQAIQAFKEKYNTDKI